MPSKGRCFFTWHTNDQPYSRSFFRSRFAGYHASNRTKRGLSVSRWRAELRHANAQSNVDGPPFFPTRQASGRRSCPCVPTNSTTGIPKTPCRRLLDQPEEASSSQEPTV